MIFQNICSDVSMGETSSQNENKYALSPNDAYFNISRTVVEFS